MFKEGICVDIKFGWLKFGVRVFWLKEPGCDGCLWFMTVNEGLLMLFEEPLCINVLPKVIGLLLFVELKEFGKANILLLGVFNISSWL